jgi:hypothetical protein
MNADTTTHNEVRGTRLLRRRGPWQRLGVIFVCLDLLIVGTIATGLDGDSGRGIAFAQGGSDVNPVSFIGSTFDHTGCQTAALSIGKGEFVVCDDWTAITNGDSTAKVVSLYASGNPVIDEYTGPLPQALHWGQTITEVTAALGQPRRITDMFGTPTLVYMYYGEKYGSLELQFDAQDKLFRINACQTH